jgi:hypothetical protein
VRSDDAAEERRGESGAPKQTAATKEKGVGREPVMNLLDFFATGSVGHTTADARRPFIRLSTLNSFLKGLVIKILSSILLNSSAPIDPLYHHLFTVGSTYHFI